MSAVKTLCLTLVALFCSSPLWPQYNFSKSVGLSDITSTCSSIDCWYALPGSGFTYVSVGADGEMWAVKADGTIYRWGGTGWTLKSGNVSLISVGSASNIWGLTSNGQVWQWNGTGWNLMTGGLIYISAAFDGTVFGVSSDRRVWQWNGSNWTLLSGLLDEAAVGSQHAIYKIERARTGCNREFDTRRTRHDPTI